MQYIFLHCTKSPTPEPPAVAGRGLSELSLLVALGRPRLGQTPERSNSLTTSRAADMFRTFVRPRDDAKQAMNTVAAGSRRGS